VSGPARIGSLPTVRRAIAAVGRVLVTVGLLILLFVAFQLWGTGIVTARAQDDLRREFEAAQQAASTTTTPSTAPIPTTTTTLPPLPPLGDGVGVIQIPKLGVDKVFVEGTGREDLKKGPGHYPGTPLPGEIGNAAIAGHRTTYGQPFYDLDKLAPGDEIITQTLAGRYTYKVRETLIVQPEDVYVVANTPDAQLTLTTCNPKFQASQRLVVKADLVPAKSATPVDSARFHTGEGDTPAPPLALADSLEGETQPLGPAYGWGAIVAVVGLVWWWLFRRWPHPLTWLAGVVPFLLMLFGFYYFLERVLPAGY
jgi:sortase A